MMRTINMERRHCPHNPLHLDILWLPRAAMRTVEADTSDCVLVVGVSRPKMALALLSVMLLSLFITFHILYDSAVYSLQTSATTNYILTSETMDNDNYRHINQLSLLSSSSSSSSRAASSRSASSAAASRAASSAIQNVFMFDTKNLRHSIDDNNLSIDDDVISFPSSASASAYSASASSSISNAIIRTNVNSNDGDNGADVATAVMVPAIGGTIRVRFPRTSRRLPQAIIVGVRKCGTRALLEMLYLHPRIQKAAGEVHFFDRDENYRKGLEWYRKKMPYSFRGQITIEKSPSYFVTPEVPERIRAMNASVKLLIIVREPVTRAISDYTQLRSHATASAAATATIPATTLPNTASVSADNVSISMGDSSLALNITGTNNNNGITGIPPTSTTLIPSLPPKSFEQLALHADGSINEQYRPIAISMYHTYMHRWLEIFPREQILIVNGDMLIEDPVSQLQKIEHFLGIESRIGRHNFYFNETKGFFCLRNDTADKCLRETKGRRHPRVDPTVITKLRRFFSEHNQRFYELVGEDFGWPEE